MKISRVLLATKITLYERAILDKPDPRMTAMLSAGDPFVTPLYASHEEHVATVQLVARVLASHGIEVTTTRKPRRPAKGRFDMVIAVGGDGTVLDHARTIDGIPLLAINSSPSTSVGYFSACTSNGFESVLEDILADRFLPIDMTRIRLKVDGREHPDPALNDILIANRIPAETSRYIIFSDFADEGEKQKSSGIWVSTAAGSTGAVLSAGGDVMDLSDRRLQYVVREPFGLEPRESCYCHVRGMVEEGVRLVSRMLDGGVYLDGRRQAVPVGYGGVVEITPSAPPLHLFLPKHTQRRK